jgi:hypothetical protein
MGNIAEFIYGEEYSEKNKAFQEEVDRIEQRHIDYFKSQPPSNETETHDRLHHHFVIRTAGGQIALDFDQEAPLPVDIRQECLEAFHRIWAYQ